MLCACVLSCFSRFRLFVTYSVDYHPPGSSLSMGFSRQEYWSGLPCPPPGDLPDPGIKIKSPASPALQAASLLLSYRGSPYIIILHKFWYYINLAYTRPCLITSVKITSPTLNKYNKIKVSFPWKSAILTMMWCEFQKISKNTHRYLVCTHMKGERWKRETDRRKSFLSLWRRVNNFLTSIDIKSFRTLGRTRALWSTEVVPRPECWDAMLDSNFYEETMEEAKGPFQGFSFHQGRLCLDTVLWLTFWEKTLVCGMCQFLRCKYSHHGWLHSATVELGECTPKPSWAACSSTRCQGLSGGFSP